MKRLESMSQVWAHLESGGRIWWQPTHGRRRIARLLDGKVRTDEPAVLGGLPNDLDYHICDEVDEAAILMERHSAVDLAEMLAKLNTQHAAAGDALGTAWAASGLSLAQGIHAKTTFFEREVAQLESANARLKKNLTEARLSMEMCCEEPCGSCAGCTRASEVHEGGAS